MLWSSRLQVGRERDMPHGRGRPLACVWAAIALLAAGGLLSPSHAQTDSSTTAQGDAVKGARAKTDAAAKTLKRARRLLGDAAVKGTQQQVTDALQTVNDATRAFNDAEAGEAALDPQVVAAERAEQDAEHASDTDPTDKTKADARGSGKTGARPSYRQGGRPDHDAGRTHAHGVFSSPAVQEGHARPAEGRSP